MHTVSLTRISISLLEVVRKQKLFVLFTILDLGIIFVRLLVLVHENITARAYILRS